MGDKLYVYGPLTALEEEDAKSGKFTIIRPEIGTYLCTHPEPNCSFTGELPETVFQVLTKHLDEAGIEWKIREDKWKLTFEKTEVINAPANGTRSQEDLEELQKYGLDLSNEEQESQSEERVQISIEILRVENSNVNNTFCIKVSYKGSSGLFMKAQHTIQESLDAFGTLECPVGY